MEVGVGEDEDVSSAQAEALIATLAHRIKRFRITNSKLGVYKCNLHRLTSLNDQGIITTKLKLSRCKCSVLGQTSDNRKL